MTEIWFIPILEKFLEKTEYETIIERESSFVSWSSRPKLGLIPSILTIVDLKHIHSVPMEI